MKRIKFVVDTGYVSCDHEITVEVDNNISEEELDEMLEDFVWSCISADWFEVGKDGLSL